MNIEELAECCERMVAVGLPLARVVEIIRLNRMAVGLLDTCVGNSAGERIMGGRSGAATPRR
jgi:hypothetical protein